MSIQNSWHRFESLKGSGPQTAVVSVNFPSVVKKASAILTGFNVEFTPRDDDHHLGMLNVQVSAPNNVNGTAVPVTVTFGLRDWTGDWDDQYDGSVMFSVIAE